MYTTIGLIKVRINADKLCSEKKIGLIIPNECRPVSIMVHLVTKSAKFMAKIPLFKDGLIQWTGEIKRRSRLRRQLVRENNISVSSVTGIHFKRVGEPSQTKKEQGGGSGLEKN